MAYQPLSVFSGCDHLRADCFVAIPWQLDAILTTALSFHCKIINSFDPLVLCDSMDPLGCLLSCLSSWGQFSTRFARIVTAHPQFSSDSNVKRVASTTIFLAANLAANVRTSKPPKPKFLMRQQWTLTLLPSCQTWKLVGSTTLFESAHISTHNSWMNCESEHSFNTYMTPTSIELLNYWTNLYSSCHAHL